MLPYSDDFSLVLVSLDGDRTHSLMKKIVFDFGITSPMVVVASRSFQDASLVNWWKGVAKDRGMSLSLKFNETENPIALLNEGIRVGIERGYSGILALSDLVDIKSARVFDDFREVSGREKTFMVGKLVYYPNTVNVFRGVRGSLTFPYFSASFVGGASSCFDKSSLFDERYTTFSFAGMDFYTRQRSNGYDFIQARNGDVRFLDEDDVDLTKDYQKFRDSWRDVIYEEY